MEHDATLDQRPMTRAWTALLQGAKRDAAQAKQFRQQADKYLRECNDLARKRIARRKNALAQLTPPQNSNSGCGWEVDWGNEEELKRFGGGEGWIMGGVEVVTGEVEVLRRMLEKETSWKVKATAFQRFEFIVEKLKESLSSEVVVDDDDEEEERKWYKYSEAIDKVVGPLGEEVTGLRGTLVKQASSAGIKAAKLFNSEQLLSLLESALTARTKTKKVMADAGDALARALLSVSLQMEIWNYVAEMALSGPHPIQRQSCVEYVADIGLDLSIEGFEEVVKKLVEGVMVDKADGVRNAGKRLYSACSNKDKVKAEQMIESLPQDVKNRLVVGSGGSKSIKSKNKDGGVNGAGRKEQGKSMRDIIRERRRQMKSGNVQNGGFGEFALKGKDNSKSLVVDGEDKENQAVNSRVTRRGKAFANAQKTSATQFEC